MDAYERIARGLLDPVAALEEKDAEIERLRALLENTADEWERAVWAFQSGSEQQEYAREQARKCRRALRGEGE